MNFDSVFQLTNCMTYLRSYAFIDKVMKMLKVELVAIKVVPAKSIHGYHEELTSDMSSYFSAR